MEAGSLGVLAFIVFHRPCQEQELTQTPNFVGACHEPFGAPHSLRLPIQLQARTVGHAALSALDVKEGSVPPSSADAIAGSC